jgi:hypothetical protein
MEDNMTLKKRGLKLLQEPSTYAGIGFLLVRLFDSCIQGMLL